MSFDRVKQMLIDNPEHIINILEHYEFYRPTMTPREIRCGYGEGHNPTSIVINLIHNEGLWVTDYARNNRHSDLMGYISDVRQVPLRDVLAQIKNELGVVSLADKPRQMLFGGIFEAVNQRNYDVNTTVLPEEMLNRYESFPNIRFLRDGISVNTQKKYGIRYSVEDQRIVIPIRNAYGELIGVKGRCNYTPKENEPKYLYLEPCPMSATLYGYNENYTDILNNDVYVFESEKAVMQADSMGIHNAVALGSNSLSQQQAKLLMSLQPKSIVFMLDNSLPIENTFKNIEVLKGWFGLDKPVIKYFDWRECKLLDEKDSPTDKGIEVYQEIIKSYVKEFEGVEKAV